MTSGVNVLKEQLPGAARLRYGLGSHLSVHSWDFHWPSIAQPRGFAAYRSPLPGNGALGGLQKLRDPSPQPMYDIHFITGYALLRCISKSPLFCREHVILVLDFCIGQGFSLIVFTGDSPMVSQHFTQCHSTFPETSVTSLTNSGWEREVDSENYHVNNLYSWLFVFFISMLTVWTGKLFGG